MDGDTKPGAVVVSAKKRFRPFRRMAHPNSAKKQGHSFVWVSITGMVILGTGAGVWWYRQQQIGTNNQCNGRDDSPIYKEAATVNTPSSQVALGKVVRKMKDMKNFESDSSCLYFATTYYLSADDISNASKYFKMLDKAYANNKKYVSNMGPQDIKSIDQLKFEISSKSNRSSESIKNFQRFNEGTQ